MWWRRTQFRWLPKRTKMRELSRWPCCYIKRLPKMENWERHCDPQIYRKDFIRWCWQTFTTLFRPTKGFICNCNTDPSSNIQDLFHPGPEKSDFQLTLRPRLSIWIYFELLPDTIGYIRWNHSRNPVLRDAPSLDETSPPPHTTPEQKNETTIPNTASALQSAASNDIINVLRSLPSLPTLLTLEDGGPIREISLLHGFPVSHQTQVRDPPLKPPGTIKTATKDKTKSKEKIHLRISWLTST